MQRAVTRRDQIQLVDLVKTTITVSTVEPTSEQLNDRPKKHSKPKKESRTNMNALFGSLTTDGLEEVTDRLGGFQPFDTDIYAGTIKAMYAGQADSGARNVTVIADFGGREYRETIYVTNKKGENFFLNKQDPKKKVPLPGFTTIDDICLIATGKPLAEQTAEDKVIKVWDRDAGAEIPKTVPMLVDCLNQPIKLGIVRQLENKSEKSGDEYVPTAETREINFIDKVFHPEMNMTVVEAKNGAEKATFHDSWLERNKGETRDKRTIKDGEGGNTGRPGAARQAPQAGQQQQKKSLFAKA